MDTNIIKKDIQPNIWLLIEEYNTTYEAILAVVNMKEHVTLQRCNQQNPDYNFTGQAVWFLQQINCKEGEKQVNQWDINGRGILQTYPSICGPY